MVGVIWGFSGGYLLQEAGVSPVISLYPPLSDDDGPKWDCVFPNVTVLENEKRVLIKVGWQGKWQRSPSRQRCQTQTISVSFDGGLRVFPNKEGFFFFFTFNNLLCLRLC